MTVFDHLPVNFWRLIFSDVKYLYSERANAMIYYSEQFNQIIYIKESHQKSSISKNLFEQHRDRMIYDAFRKMQKIYGKKRGREKFLKADILYVLISSNVSNKIFRYLWAFNKLLRTQHKKSYFMIFDTNKTDEKQIGSTICGALYKKFNRYLEICKKTLKAHDAQPFGSLKAKLSDFEYACDKLYSKQYELMGQDKLKKKFEIAKEYDLNIIAHNLAQGRVLRPVGKELRVEVNTKHEQLGNNVGIG